MCLRKKIIITALAFFCGVLFTGLAPQANACTASTVVPSVTICTPLANSTGASPVHVTSLTTDNVTVKLNQVYLDGAKIYEVAAATVNTYVPTGVGTHRLTVQGYDSAARIFKQTIYITVGSTSTTSTSTSASTSTSSTTPTSTSGSSTPSGATLSSYGSNLSATSYWLAKQQLPDGAILYATNEIEPYWANIAAMGWLKDSTKYSQVEAWMKWYIAHLNKTDVWGLGGTMYDYTVSGSVETPKNTADSTDSYAATFLTLAWDYYRTGNLTAQSYVKSILPELNTIAQVLVKTQQSDGLTWAQPSYKIKYLMDNCEGYRGLRDIASLYSAVGNSTQASYYNARATAMYNGIMGMWMGSAFAVYKNGVGGLVAPNWSTWYADATSQLFLVLEQVLPASDPRAQQVYKTFNSHWPGWPNLSFNSTDAFPWVLVAHAAAGYGDTTRMNTYITNIQNKYVSKSFPWPWYNAEGGWFLRLNGYMMGKGY
jgi:hypothetical protein